MVVNRDGAGPQRRPIVGVMGSGTSAGPEAADVGRLIAELGAHLLTGGGDGVMAAASRAFYETPGRAGLVIGVLPCVDGDPSCAPKPGYPNPWVELPIRTHLPLSGAQGEDNRSRNHINVLTPDAIIALRGGAGTLSEIALALRYGRPVAAYAPDGVVFDGLPSGICVLRSLEEVAAFLGRCVGVDSEG